MWKGKELPEVRRAQYNIKSGFLCWPLHAVGVIWWYSSFLGTPCPSIYLCGRAASSQRVNSKNPGVLCLPASYSQLNFKRDMHHQLPTPGSNHPTLKSWQTNRETFYKWNTEKTLLLDNKTAKLSQCCRHRLHEGWGLSDSYQMCLRGIQKLLETCFLSLSWARNTTGMQIWM